MDFGDTNFIGVANTNKYESFVDEDWELDIISCNILETR